MADRPRSRQKRVTGGSGVSKRGSGLGSGPVGSGSYSGRGGSSFSGGAGSGGHRSSGHRSGGSRSPLSLIVILIVALLGGGGGLGAMFFGGSSDSDWSGGSNGGQSSVGEWVGGNTGSWTGSWGGASLGGNGWELGNNTGSLNTKVDGAARGKYTEILGNGRDTVTIMVYMCGTDLESRSGMGTSDLQEMIAADLGSNVNLIVYTGGCRSWRNNVISSQVHQIYQVKDGGLIRLEADMGTGSMTDPDTLVTFIQWCAKHYPANRNQLIFWDHGGGSLSGYGYDEKVAGSGSMSLAGIDTALKKGGVSFDFIGFDACLMATMETALMLSQYADYMIASEETEPGVGWYYTDWLTALGEDPSMATIQIGKRIADDFVDTCARECKGQKTTLSVVDLAELEMTAPAAMTAFAAATTELIREDSYKTVSDARYGTREFSPSSSIDQVDLVHLAENMGTEEGRELAQILLSAVKYNRTSGNMTNAYGLSIYFPYRKVSNVDEAVETYELIGMDEEYARCIQEFASMEVSGQTAAGGATSPVPSLFGSLAGGSQGNGFGGLLSGSSSGGNAELIAQMLVSFLSQDFGNIAGLTGANTGFFSGRSLSTEEMARYVSDNYFDASGLVWQRNDAGQHILSLPESQWELIHSLELNMFYDDGEGYIDLGTDNVFTWDENGNLIGDTDRTWLAINGQPVAYYFESMTEDGDAYTITGLVPALLNGQRVNLILVFDDANPYGYIAGARADYVNGETDTVAKALTQLERGDVLDFLCDYYSYDGEYLDSYYLGEQMVVTDEMMISNVYVGNGEVQVMYRLTDIYHQKYWTPAFTQ